MVKQRLIANESAQRWGRWAHGYRAHLQIKRLGKLCYIPRQDTLPLSTQVYKWVLANLILWVTSHPGGSRNTPSHFMLQKPGRAPA